MKDIKKGEIITEEQLKSIRPGFGGHPRFLNQIIGKTSDSELKKGDRFLTDNIKF